MISPAFFDELEKIGEAERPPMSKEKFRRALAVAGTAGLGSGLGYGTAKLVGNLARKHGWVSNVPTQVLRKYGPPIVGALAAGGGALLAISRQKSDKYIDEGKRPKQHRPLSK